MHINHSRFKKVNCKTKKKSRKEKEKAFCQKPRKSHYVLKYQIQMHPAIDACMFHPEKCVWEWEKEKERKNLRCFFSTVNKLYFGRHFLSGGPHAEREKLELNCTKRFYQDVHRQRELNCSEGTRSFPYMHIYAAIRTSTDKEN